MMIVKKKKVANPHRHRAKNAKRRLTPKQIKFFGTKRQRAALKAKRTASNPKKRKARKNPAQLITLGFMGNPHKTTKKRKKNSMATLTKKQKRSLAGKKAARTRKANAAKRRVVRASNPTKRRRTKKRNSTRIVVMAPRKKNARRNGRRYRRNPELFGRSVNAVEMGKQVLAGLVGVTITKAVPGMLPSAATSSPIIASATSVVVALVSGWAAGKVMPDIGSAVMFGGLMQAGSVILNQFLPSVGTTIGLSGLGNLIGPARFAVPQNPLLLPAGTVVAPTASQRIGVSGLGRAFKPAF